MFSASPAKVASVLEQHLHNLGVDERLDEHSLVFRDCGEASDSDSGLEDIVGCPQQVVDSHVPRSVKAEDVLAPYPVKLEKGHN